MFIEAKDDGGGGDNWTTGAMSRAKLQSNCHHQQTNIQFFLQAGCPSCQPTNSVKALKGTADAGSVLFICCLSVIAEKVYLGDTGGALYDGQQQVLYWADVSTELAFAVPSPTSHALAAGKAL